MHAIKTHSVTPAKIALAVSFMFVAGAAAFAAAAIPRQLKGFKNFYVLCQDNTSAKVVGPKKYLNGRLITKTAPVECKPSLDWQQQAREFCKGKVGKNGKTGYRTFSVTGSCKISQKKPLSPPFSAPRPITPPPSGYGYNAPPVPEYGYGYNFNVGSATASVRPTYSALMVLPPEIVLNKEDVIELRLMGIENGTQVVPVSGGVWETEEIGTILSQEAELLRLRVDRTQGLRQLQVSYTNPDGTVLRKQVDLNIQ